MNFHILTLMPEVIAPYFSESILGRAFKKGIIHVACHQLRDYATSKHANVDDRPYGGGPGMVLRADVVVPAVRDLKQKYSIDRVVLLSPRGRLLTHEVAEELAGYESLLLICGRYEGLDERAIELVVDEEISIGDYVITGGELAAQVVVDAVSRMIPGVVGDEEGPLNDSHSQGILEYPHYTRPPLYEGLEVPSILLTGDHAKIDQWRYERALKCTQERRPDLLAKNKKEREGK